MNRRAKFLQSIFVLATLTTLASAQPNESPRGRKGSVYTIDQAISDNAQLHTIAFSGLAFITGDFGASTFIPPGKVCDYFGFQYLRDIDQDQAGHNPKFLSRLAGNVLKTLDAKQLDAFHQLALEQEPQYIELAKMRLPLIRAFCDNLQAKYPSGSRGLNKEAVREYVGNIFAKDGEMSLRRAEVFGKVALSLTADQKSFFSKVKFGDFSTWPDVDEREEMRKLGPAKSKMESVAFMTYASEFYSWYAGSIDADTYFCPERHGTYFGGFYMKDMPAMGKRDFNISLSRTSDSGKDFLNTLTPEQKGTVTKVIESQKSLLKETVELRRKISTEMRKYLSNSRPNRDEVIKMCRRYGEADGEMSWMYATAFAEVNRTLTKEQRARLVEIRNLDGYKSAPYYIYSDAVKQGDTSIKGDQFFFAPTK
ncbi:MAG: hypothetical protein JST40_02235 [Armatimonadetes bacterium]|nr:hypothetical protein [Armatimonadota bacterium]